MVHTACTVLVSEWRTQRARCWCMVHIACTVLVSEWRTKYRRSMNDASNAQDQASVDSILNFETVKYHAAEQFEVERYAGAVQKHLVSLAHL